MDVGMGGVRDEQEQKHIGSPLLCITPFPGDSMPFSDLCAQAVHIYACKHSNNIMKENNYMKGRGQSAVKN